MTVCVRPRLAPGARFSIGSFALHYQRGPAREMARAAELEAELERAFRYTQALLPAPITEGPVRAEWCFRPSARIVVRESFRNVAAGRWMSALVIAATAGLGLVAANAPGCAHRSRAGGTRARAR